MNLAYCTLILLSSTLGCPSVDSWLHINCWCRLNVFPMLHWRKLVPICLIFKFTAIRFPRKIMEFLHQLGNYIWPNAKCFDLYAGKDADSEIPYVLFGLGFNFKSQKFSFIHSVDKNKCVVSHTIQSTLNLERSCCARN